MCSAGLKIQKNNLLLLPAKHKSYIFCSDSGCYLSDLLCSSLPFLPKKVLVSGDFIIIFTLQLVRTSQWCCKQLLSARRLNVFQWWMKCSFVNSLSVLLEIHEQESYLQQYCDVFSLMPKVGCVLVWTFYFYKASFVYALGKNLPQYTNHLLV